MNRMAMTMPSADTLAAGLGWFSIGLGLMELTSAHRVARVAGLRAPSPRAANVVRALGARELAHGVAILAAPHAAAPVASRVIGDALDLGMLRAGVRSGPVDRRRAGAAAAMLLGIGIIDALVARRLANRERSRPLRQPVRPVRVDRAATINKPVDEVYRFWRDLEGLPRVMRHLHRVKELDERFSHWTVRAPGGLEIQWEAEILEDVPNQRLRWQSVASADIHSRGTVSFRPAPGGKGTELHVEIWYEPPAGQVGRGVAWLVGGALERQIHEDLRRCKQVLETGDVTLSDGPGLWRPARPAADPQEVLEKAGVTR